MSLAFAAGRPRMKTLGSAVVEIEHDQQATTKHVLGSGSYVLGSAEGCDLVLAASGVSRRHLRLEVLVDGGVVVTDLGSSNGSRHGKRKIQTMAMTEPTRLRLGDARLTVHPDSDQARVVALPALAALAATSARSVEASVATDMPQSGWTIVQGLGADLDRLDSGQPFAAVIANVVARWSQQLDNASIRVRSLQPTAAIVAAVGPNFTADPESLSTLRHAGLQLEIDCAPALISVNLRLALRIGLAALSNSATVGPADPQAKQTLSNMPTEVISASREMAQLYELATKVAKGGVSVLVQGESGSGKELLANWVHQQSPRHDGPFLAINCAALPAELLEAEIFGIERGIATGVDARPGLLERARGGTVFLDELGDMALPTQAKILRALESATIYRVGGTKAINLDVRFVAATHRSLASLIDAGTFRLDLYHRIAAVELELPPLRERRVDIALLATHFLATELASLQRSSPGITDAALASLCSYEWPGNVRELRNEMARAALLLQAHQPLDWEHLSKRLRSAVPAQVDLSLEAAINKAEAEAIALAMAAANDDHATAMALLKLTRSSYFRRLQNVRERCAEDPAVDSED